MVTTTRCPASAAHHLAVGTACERSRPLSSRHAASLEGDPYAVRVDRRVGGLDGNPLVGGQGPAELFAFGHMGCRHGQGLFAASQHHGADSDPGPVQNLLGDPVAVALEEVFGLDPHSVELQGPTDLPTGRFGEGDGQALGVYRNDRHTVAVGVDRYDYGFGHTGGGHGHLRSTDPPSRPLGHPGQGLREVRSGRVRPCPGQDSAAFGHALQPSGPLRVGAVGGDRPCAERRDGQQRNRGHPSALLFEDQAGLHHAQAEAPVAFGERYADQARFGQGLPEAAVEPVVGGLHLGHTVGRCEVAEDPFSQATKGLLVIGQVEVHSRSRRFQACRAVRAMPRPIQATISRITSLTPPPNVLIWAARAAFSSSPRSTTPG